MDRTANRKFPTTLRIICNVNISSISSLRSKTVHFLMTSSEHYIHLVPPYVSWIKSKRASSFSSNNDLHVSTFLYDFVVTYTLEKNYLQILSKAFFSLSFKGVHNRIGPPNSHLSDLAFVAGWVQWLPPNCQHVELLKLVAWDSPSLSIHHAILDLINLHRLQQVPATRRREKTSLCPQDLWTLIEKIIFIE